MKFDYSNYEQLLKSFDFKSDPFNPDFEDFKDYIDISEDFDPINNPPEDKDKKDYIYKYIVPIMKQHAKDLRAILSIDEHTSNIVITLISDKLIILDDNYDLKHIFFFASSFFIFPSDNNKLKLELFFSI